MSKREKLDNRRKKVAVVLLVALVLILLMAGWLIERKSATSSMATMNGQSKTAGVRTAANFCKARVTEMVRLRGLPNNGGVTINYVFPTPTTDEEIATSFDNVEKYAPDEIRSDIVAVGHAYRTNDAYFTAHATDFGSYDGDGNPRFVSPLEAAHDNVNRVDEWVTKNCGSGRPWMSKQ